ncbi:MAG: hypothetical protein RKP46_12030 [Candidatus Accumulibacter sp.]|uniref:hypothetical protein n=1 Tax=Accumulibacter sp. TaxID=2053492 RepID=UPI002878B729|nr:hypothetical protein [Accumulibacter sp.]MDS4015059.1 hypothetical protein [Accumulibacter sp.]
MPEQRNEFLLAHRLAPLCRWWLLLPIALCMLLGGCTGLAPRATPSADERPSQAAGGAPEASPTRRNVRAIAPAESGAVVGALPGGVVADAGSRPDAVTAPIPRFAWPPPKASAEVSIPDKWVRNATDATLASVADKLEKALRLAEYADWSYYAVPGGFALATHVEQIKPDGTPMAGADRWRTGTPSVSNLSLLEFILALAHAPPGSYRAIVFIVSDAVWAQSPAAPTGDEIAGWARSGASGLPAAIGKLSYGPEHRVQALVYEFRKGHGGPAALVMPSRVSGERHLYRGGLWKPLSIL